MKFCKKCGTDTVRNKRGNCKACAKNYSAKYYALNYEKVNSASLAWKAKNIEKVRIAESIRRKENKEKINLRIKKWRIENPERAKQIQSDYRLRNKEQINTYQASYRLKNVDSIRDAVYLWRAKNPEAYRAVCAKRRARKRNAEGSYTAEDICRIMVLQKSKCACCKKNIKDDYHIDHIIPLAKGGSNDRLNVQLLCPRCNRQKGAKNPIEFMQQQGYLL